jgi:hypothetical protein
MYRQTDEEILRGMPQGCTYTPLFNPEDGNSMLLQNVGIYL